MKLNQSETLRYARHFPVIGNQGQQQLKEAKILCVGVGGLGCPALQYLAAAGVGTLGIIDGDQVDLTNLQRQILFQTTDIGRFKVEAAKERLLALNPELTINSFKEFLSKDQGYERIKDYDLVLDATDNYSTRYLLNELCRTLNTPLVSASIYQFEAQLSVFNYQLGPCYQCLYPNPPPPDLIPNCALGGVLGVLPGVIGVMQATEALKIILGRGNILSGTLLSIDLLSMRFQQFTIEKQDCSLHPILDFQSEASCTAYKEKEYEFITAQELHELLLSDKEAIRLIDVRQDYEREISNIGGEHIPLAELEELAKHFTALREFQKKSSEKQLTVIYCKSGARANQACGILKNAGFKKIYNLKGGILSWIDSIDGRLLRY